MHTKTNPHKVAYLYCVVGCSEYARTWRTSPTANTSLWPIKALRKASALMESVWSLEIEVMQHLQVDHLSFKHGPYGYDSKWLDPKKGLNTKYTDIWSSGQSLLAPLVWILTLDPIGIFADAKAPQVWTTDLPHPCEAKAAKKIYQNLDDRWIWRYFTNLQFFWNVRSFGKKVG